MHKNKEQWITSTIKDLGTDNSWCRSENDFTTIVEIIAWSLLGHSLEGFGMPHPLSPLPSPLPPPPSPLLYKTVCYRKLVTYTDFILHFGENTWIRRLPFNNSQPRPCIGVEPRWFIFRAVSCGRFNYFDDECLSTKGFNSHCTCCHCFTLNKLLFELKITSRKNWTWF